MPHPIRYLFVGLVVAARPVAAQAREDSVARGRDVLEARVRAAERAAAGGAEGAWRAVLRAADSLEARFGPRAEFWIPRGVAAIRIADARVEVARRAGSCAAARRARGAVADAAAALPADSRVALPGLDSLLPRLAAASEAADALVRRRCE